MKNVTIRGELITPESIMQINNILVFLANGTMYRKGYSNEQEATKAKAEIEQG